jgi:hypothetical protein
MPHSGVDFDPEDLQYTSLPRYIKQSGLMEVKKIIKAAYIFHGAVDLIAIPHLT